MGAATRPVFARWGDWELRELASCGLRIIHRLDFIGGNLRGYALKSLVLPLLLMVGALGQGLAQVSGNRTYVGQDIFVAAGQQVHNATCLFCSVQVEGDVTGRVLVLFGSVNVSGQVHRSATVVWGNAVVDSQARIGGDTVVLGGNAVYEADESLSGSAYVLGGHLSHVTRPSGEGERRHRVNVSPFFFWGLAVVVVLLLLSWAFGPRVRQHVAVSQST
jgi:hypothetical protein